MLHKTGQKRGSCFVHYFLLYAIVVAYLPFTSCGGVRTELIPERNVMLGDLSDEAQGAYLRLNQLLDDEGREKLEQTVKKIESADVLDKFIEQSLQNHIAYNNLLKLLFKSEQTTLKQKFAKAVNPSEQSKLIEPYLSALKILQRAPMHTHQNYIDLLEVVSDDRAIALKNAIVQSTSLDEVNQVIASWLPTSFKQLDDHRKEALSKLSDHERQEVLKVAMSQNDTKDGGDTGKAQPNKVQSTHTPTVSNTPNNGHSIPSALDINQLIEQKVKEQAAKVDDDIPQDGWGSKLSLEGEERKQFLTSIMQFSQSDQKMLKELFNKAERNSIDNFLSVYHTGFNKDERIKLLSTMIYLYKGWPPLMLKLCNNPTSVGCMDKFSLYNNTNKIQLKLLTKLDSLLSQ